MARGHWKRAITSFDEAIRLNPTDAGSYRDRGAAYGQRGDYRSSLDDLDRALELLPEDPQALFFRGLCFEATRKRRQALDDFNRILALPSSEFTEKAQAEVRFLRYQREYSKIG